MFNVKVYDLESAMASSAVADSNTSDMISSAARCEVCGDDDDGGGGDGSSQKETTKAVNFSSGNPRVETTRGVMHLFRNVSSPPHSSGGQLPAKRSEHLCVLAIPSHMTGAEFCKFMGAFLQNVQEMRFVRNDGQSERYSAIMKFDSQSSADDFFRHYNGKPFSSFEEEVCHVLFTADVQYTNSIEEASSAPVGLTELPTCPVCLERLDEHISGILTTVCNHSFHSSCISNWADSSCPVCRYCQEPSAKSTCTICSTLENLWICVICGFVGCGRYQQGHAISHWKESQHCYSMEVETQRVWDYVSDGYVHRLIQSKTDGKLVELNAPCRDGCGSCECSQGSGMQEALVNSKVDAYYEGLLSELKQEKEVAISKAVDKAVSLKLQKMQAKLLEVEEEKKFLKEVNESMKANQDSWKAMIKEVEAREKATIKEREERIADLEEQVRDYMIFIEAQKSIEASGSSEIRDGTVLTLPAVSSPRQTSRPSKSGCRRKR